MAKAEGGRRNADGGAVRGARDKLKRRVRRSKPESENARHKRDASNRTDDSLADIALIYVPHLAHRGDGTTDDLAERLAAVLDGNDSVAKNRYKINPSKNDARYGSLRPKAKAESSAVTRVGRNPGPVVDLYEFDYSESMFGRFDRAPSLVKSLRLLLTATLSLIRVLTSLVAGRGKDRTTRLRGGVVSVLLLTVLVVLYLTRDATNAWAWLPWAAGSFALLSTFLSFTAGGDKAQLRVIGGFAGVLVFAGVLIKEHLGDYNAGELVAFLGLAFGTVALIYISLKLANDDLGDRVQLLIALAVIGLMTMYAAVLLTAIVVSAADALSDDRPVSEERSDKATDPWQAVALVLAAGGVVLVPKRIRQQLNDAASHFLGAVNYLSMGEGRDSEIGRFYDLVEYLSEQGYKEIAIVGYSFGSVIALDAVYPPAGKPPKRISKVKRIITVGCPARTISTFWPLYWSKRDLDTWDGEWTNIYSPFDVLSSDWDGKDQWTSQDEETAQYPTPDHQEVFNSGPATEDLKAWQKAVLGGLRAHAHYWHPRYAHDRGAVSLFATRLIDGGPAPANLNLTSESVPEDPVVEPDPQAPENVS